ncbi:MAG TPA: tetratricopeptide repeat protein [Ignavibacteriales bacterium]|nr:tetratricopeptide repeat protein [Ignavibacteriales bacterium]
MTGLYEKALDFFKAEEYASAKECLVSLLQYSGETAETLFLLGIIEGRLQNLESSNAMFSRTLELESGHFEAAFNLALNYKNTGELEAALFYFKKAQQLNPGFDKAGDYALSLGTYLAKRTEAEKCLSEQKFAEAKDIFLEIQKEYSSDYRLIHRLADTYYNLGQFEKAIESYYNLISLKGTNELVIYNIALCYKNLKNYEIAFRLYRQAVDMNPLYTDALNNLGLLYSEIKDFKKAAECYNQALEADPACISALTNLGNLKLLTDNFDEMIRINEKVLSIIADKLRNQSDSRCLDQSRAIAYSNIGFAYYHKCQVDIALEYYGLSIESFPGYVTAHYNRAQACLLKGNFKEGFQEYTWRMLKDDWGPRRFRDLPSSDELSGKRVLVYAEQGLGDAIQFVRYTKKLKQAGCTVAFECDRKLIDLFKNLPWIDEFIEKDPSKHPSVPYDYAIPMMSLPKYFETELNDIPCEDAYITPERNLVEKWAKIINSQTGLNNKLKVGIVWGGNPNHKNDSRRSCSLENFEDLFELENVRFFSLQVGPAASQIEKYSNKISDLQLNNEDGFLGTAAMISSLDLIISVDTSVAHLAGAMGKKTWMLLPFLPDWRWMLEREDTPWYPTAKLFRQKALGDWNSVFEEVKACLERELGKTRFDTNIEHSEPIYLALSSGDNFGWGICSRYLKEELSKKTAIEDIAASDELKNSKHVPGTVVHAITNLEFNSLCAVKGKRNFGYTFFEYELNEKSKENAHSYDLVIGGSRWNMDKMKKKGINNSDFLIQGIDPELFYPSDELNTDDHFIIFSGGKFELRKGQDLVLKAVKILQQKFPDIVLINAWYNKWPSTMQTMSFSKHIEIDFSSADWEEFILRLIRKNGLDENRIITLPLVPNRELRSIYLKSHIGLFPNRCEGGTNLVMMEYMACGRPVAASFNTGHMDILTDENSIPLKSMHDFHLYDGTNKLVADWKEPHLDEIVAAVEYAYFNREAIRQTGICAGEYMKQFTWAAAAENLLKLLR